MSGSRSMVTGVRSESDDRFLEVCMVYRRQEITPIEDVNVREMLAGNREGARRAHGSARQVSCLFHVPVVSAGSAAERL